jgi:hypothetical protein
MGTNDVDDQFDTFLPEVAYNSADNEFLVIWKGDDDTGSLIDNEFEAYGQRLNASTGAEVGTNDFRISDMGTDGSTAGGVAGFINGPAVAYNSASNEYLVVWEGDDSPGLTADGEQEIFGQRLAGDGSEIGANDFRISDMGPGGNVNYDAYDVGLAYLPGRNGYLAVWRGDDVGWGTLEGEEEIFGQALDAFGTEVGVNDFRISDVAGNGDIERDAVFPRALAGTGIVLVVWHADDSDVGTPALGDNENEVFGQRLAAGAFDTFIAAGPRL